MLQLASEGRRKMRQEQPIDPEPDLVQETEELLRRLKCIESNRQLTLADRVQSLLDCASQLRRLNRRYEESCL